MKPFGRTSADRPGHPSNVRQEAASAEPGLLELWHERNRLIGQLRELDERTQQDRHAALSQSWDEIDAQIVSTASRTSDDLRAKLAFMRWWLEEPDDGQQYQLIASILDDVERMFLRPDAHPVTGPDEPPSPGK